MTQLLKASQSLFKHFPSRQSPFMVTYLHSGAVSDQVNALALEGSVMSANLTPGPALPPPLTGNIDVKCCFPEYRSLLGCDHPEAICHERVAAVGHQKLTF